MIRWKLGLNNRQRKNEQMLLKSYSPFQTRFRFTKKILLKTVFILASVKSLCTNVCFMHLKNNMIVGVSSVYLFYNKIYTTRRNGVTVNGIKRYGDIRVNKVRERAASMSVSCRMTIHLRYKSQSLFSMIFDKVCLGQVHLR